MLDASTIATCNRLLGMFPGVTVEHTTAHSSGRAGFILRITESASVYRLACCASDACIPFLVWPVGQAWPLKKGATIDPDVSSPNRVQYQLAVEPSSAEDEQESRVITLCVGMAETLASLGLIEREEVRELRAGWGF